MTREELQAILHARKERFGASSEASVPGQLSLLGDGQMEALAEALGEQKQEMAVPDKKPSVAKRSGVRRDRLAGLPVEVTVCELDPKETCDVCGAPLEKVGRKVVRSEVEYIKTQVIVRQYVQCVYKCTKCGTEESENERDHFVSAAVPGPLLNHCIASPSVMTEILYEKYFKGVSLKRQENMWRGWHGSLVTDAYADYDKVEDITRGLCWSHVRRKYIDSIPLDSRGKEIPGSKGSEARELIDQLFYIEGRIRELPPEKRLKQRQELSQKVLDAFWVWVEKTSSMAPKPSQRVLQKEQS